MDRREYAECFQKLVDCFVKEEKFIQDIELMDKPNLDEIEQNAVLSYRAANREQLVQARFIPASNEPSSHACMDIWRLPRGSNTPLLCSAASLIPRCKQRGI